MSSYTMSDSSKTSQPSTSRSHTTRSELADYEQWSEISSPYDSANPSRNSLSTDGDDMSMDHEKLASSFLHAVLADTQHARSNAAPPQAISRANCNPLKMPKNFAQVLPDIYRAHYPTTENFTFLRMLGIRTILTLVPEECSEPYRDFMSQFRIQHFQIGIEPNKNPAVTIDPASMAAALEVIACKQNHPILIHCNKGKHRTGCVIGCLRKVLGGEIDQIKHEYRQFAGEKARILDERYIEAFDEKPLQSRARRKASSVPEPFEENLMVKKTTPSTRLRS